ncbi:hypothetical protein D3C76_1629950 [compost metagenome]
MQMAGICVCLTYADAWHVDMFSLCYFFSFSGQIRKKAKSDLWSSRFGEMKFAVTDKNLVRRGKGLSPVSMVPYVTSTGIAENI